MDPTCIKLIEKHISLASIYRIDKSLYKWDNHHLTNRICKNELDPISNSNMVSKPTSVGSPCY